MLYNLIITLLSTSSVAFWCVIIWSVIQSDISMLKYMYVNNNVKLVLAIVFPYIYVVGIMLYWVYKFFRNVFTIKWR